MGLPLLRGTTDYADCENCPFSRDGRPSNPVLAEFPQDPAFLLVGEWPGRNEVLHRRPMVGETGQTVNRILGAAGSARDRVLISNATLCLPTTENPALRDQAMRACNVRLKMELRQFPGKPILTMGTTAAKAIIPQAALDAIDPPDVAPSHKKKAKEKQKSIDKAERAKEKRREQLAERLIRRYIKQWNRTAKREALAKWHPEVLAAIEKRAYTEADDELARKEAERLAKKAATPRKPRAIGITSIAGTCFEVDIGDGTGKRLVVPTINPAAMQRGGGKAILGCHTPDLAVWNVIADAAKVNAYAAGKPIMLAFPGEIEVGSSDRAGALFYQFYKLAVEEGAFALDTETYVEDSERHHALQAYKARVRAIGLATKTWSFSVLWDLLPAWCLTLLKFLLLSPHINKIAHNLLYDRTVLRANGFIIDGPITDTLLQHHAAFPGAAHNLQSVTAQFYGVRPWKSEFRNNEETPEKLTRYCDADTYSTRKIEVALTVWIQRTETEKAYELDKRMSQCASGMHLDGVPVSRDENQELLKQFLTARDEARQAVEAMVTSKETIDLIWHHLAFEQAKKQRKKDTESFSERHAARKTELVTNHAKGKWAWKISANQHVAALLRAKGVQLLAVTDKGSTKVNKEILESLIEIPLVRDVLRFRENDKLISTFVWPLFDRTLKDGTPFYGFADEHDRVHPIWSIHKITGRWASSDPVVSNIPKAKYKKLADGTKQILRPNIRRQYVARRGRKLIGFDFKQLEARILALLSGDAWLCYVFSALDASGNPLDIHREAARIIWVEFDGLEEYMQKQLRERAKPFEYGAFYGADPETLYKQLLKEGLNVKREDVYKAYNKLMAKLSGLVAYQAAQLALASQPPYRIRTTLTERQRVFPLGQVDPNECKNWPVQSQAADIMNTGMSRMMDRILSYQHAFPILQIHDAAVFECWEDDAEALFADVIDCFTQEYTNPMNGVTVKFEVDAKIAQSWAEL